MSNIHLLLLMWSSVAEKKLSTGEAPMDNLMAELQSGFRLRPTPKQMKGPTNEGQGTILFYLIN